VADNAIVRYLEARRDEHVARIQELVRQPSVSTELLGGPEYARLLRDHYAAIGCREAHVVDTGDLVPGVWAYLDAGADVTLGCYTYFDTYGVDESGWSHPPFGGELVERDGFPQVVVGRGAGVKGSHQLWLNALEALTAVDGAAPVNLLFLSEGAEMLGSPNYERICEAAGRYLERIDAFFSPRISEGRGSREIAVVLGYKNMVTFDLVCDARRWGRGPSRGTVYGNSKSIVDAPTHRLVQALASLIEADGNRLAVAGLAHLNDERKPLDGDERALVDGLIERFNGASWNGVLPTAGGVQRWAGDVEGAEVLTEFLYGPSLNISEIRSAGVGGVPRLTMLLPHEASAAVELRLVTDIPAADVIEAVRSHLDAHGFGEVELVPQGLWDGHQTAPGEPIVRATLATLEQHGRTPVLWPIQPFGGPWAGVPRRLGVPALSGCALGYAANGGGGADEYIVVESDGSVAGMLEAETYLVDLVMAVAGALRADRAAREGVRAG
jgi:acetylornithine deacetylase/succinyl-diaminopimelate desuccinylase-like protein